MKRPIRERILRQLRWQFPNRPSWWRWRVAARVLRDHRRIVLKQRRARKIALRAPESDQRAHTENVMLTTAVRMIEDAIEERWRA